MLCHEWSVRCGNCGFFLCATKYLVRQKISLWLDYRAKVGCFPAKHFTRLCVVVIMLRLQLLQQHRRLPSFLSASLQLTRSHFFLPSSIFTFSSTLSPICAIRRHWWNDSRRATMLAYTHWICLTYASSRASASQLCQLASLPTDLTLRLDYPTRIQPTDCT